MEAVGVPEPVFYRNNFMLQTILKNNEGKFKANQDSHFQSKKANLIESPKRATFITNELGKSVLKENPEVVNQEYLAIISYKNVRLKRN